MVDVMECLAIISQNSLKAISFHNSRSPSSPDVPSPQGSQLIMLSQLGNRLQAEAKQSEANQAEE